jgi:hypothetical protein
MATTTNYSWTTPDDTALVKDGAAAIRSLGTAIDTTVFNNASAAIAKTIVDAKGDIIAATAADTVARLAVGANGTVLMADSSTATGLKWETAGGGGKVLQVVTANYSTVTEINSGTYTDTGLSATITPTASTSKILVLISQPSKTQIRASTQELQYRANYKLLRGATDINVMPLVLGITGSANSANWEGYAIANMNYLDSPATTSATTYKTQGSGGTNSGVVFQNSSSTATMTLLEIGA